MNDLAGTGTERKDVYKRQSLIRETLQQKDIYDLNRFFPEDAFYLFRQDFALKVGGASMYELTTAVLYKLRTMTPEEFARLPDVSEGLEYRLCAEAKNAVSIDDFLKRVKTKRYTMSRLKRIIICALLNIDKELMETEPPYILSLIHISGADPDREHHHREGAPVRTAAGQGNAAARAGQCDLCG